MSITPSGYVTTAEALDQIGGDPVVALDTLHRRLEQGAYFAVRRHEDGTLYRIERREWLQDGAGDHLASGAWREYARRPRPAYGQSRTKLVSSRPIFVRMEAWQGGIPMSYQERVRRARKQRQDKLLNRAAAHARLDAVSTTAPRPIAIDVTPRLQKPEPKAGRPPGSSSINDAPALSKMREIAGKTGIKSKSELARRAVQELGRQGASVETDIKRLAGKYGRQ